jgi:hypothetical protein
MGSGLVHLTSQQSVRKDWRGLANARFSDTMFLLLAAVMASQVTPGPLDAFAANYASIRAEMDFEYADCTFDGQVADLWSDKKPEFRTDRESRILGHWACDGEAESFSFRSCAEMLARVGANPPRVEAGKLFMPARYVPTTEALWDGRVLAWHTRDPIRDPAGSAFSWQAVHVGFMYEEPGCLTEGRGPFYWGFSYTFPQIIRAHFSGIVPSVRRSIRGGRPVEVEVYRREEPQGGWTQFEVSYDATQGYLPRFARIVSLASEDNALGKEMYLLQATPSAAGAFVPTEWFDTFFVVESFSKRFPHYDDDAVLKAAGKIHGGHFRASGVKTRSSPVALTDLKGVGTLNTPGGWLRIRKTGSLTLSTIRQLAGKNLTDPPKRPVLPSLDATELHEFETARRPPSRSAAWLLVLAIGAPLVAFLAWRWRARKAAWVVIAVAAPSLGGGCGVWAPPVVKLNAAFEQSPVFIEPGSSNLTMTLLLRNDGNQTVRIIKADGGCTCRKVDQSTLPLRLRPAAQIGLPVDMAAPKATSPYEAGFEFETDHGILRVNVPYFSLVSHQLDPDAATHTALTDDDPWVFELTHREVYRGTVPRSKIVLEFPKDLSAETTSVQGGGVGAAPGFFFEDTMYKVRLNNRDPGLHKAYISLRRPDGVPVLEAPVVWDRVPYLSSIPSRVTLGTRPARVFLRCPDDSVEITQILARPAGTTVLVTSPREIRITLSRDAPATIDGTVEIGTTAQGRHPLRVHVVRYSPGAAN